MHVPDIGQVADRKKILIAAPEDVRGAGPNTCEPSALSAAEAHRSRDQNPLSRAYLRGPRSRPALLQVLIRRARNHLWLAGGSGAHAEQEGPRQITGVDPLVDRGSVALKLLEVDGKSRQVH